MTLDGQTLFGKYPEARVPQVVEPVKVLLYGPDGQPISVDSSTYALNVVDYAHHEIHAGSHYFVTSYADLSNNQVIQFTFLMPNTTKWTHFVWKLSTESETLWQLYEGGTINNALANAITPLNSNRNYSDSSGTTLRYEVHANLAAADTDVDVSGATLMSSGISGAGKDSGEAERENERVLGQNTLYVARATASAAGYTNFDMEWYEHTNKE